MQPFNLIITHNAPINDVSIHVQWDAFAAASVFENRLMTNLFPQTKSS